MLVGRGTELAAIERALGALDHGRAGVIEIVGEPGIGKSCLVAESLARAEAQGALALSGRASEFEGDVPFNVFVDALDDYLGTVNPRRIDRLGDDTTRELGRIFPALADHAPAGGADALSSERFRTHRAVRLLIDSLATTAPVVLALDDLHWADEASLELLSHLLRKRSAAPVLLIVAYRRRQEPRALAAGLSVAARDGALDRIEPGPLSREDAEELIGESRLDGPTRDALYRDSGGNPFYLEQLHRALVRRPAAATSSPLSPAAGPGEVPAPVAAALEEEIEALDDRARAVLQAAAVAGQPFDPGVVACVAECPEADALAALDELLDADVVRATDVPLRFAFRHPIVRHAVYEAAGGGWRIAAHARAAEALAARGASPSARAHHVERSASPGDRSAVDLLVEAGHASVVRAPATAAHWFKTALRLLPAGSEHDGERLELLVPMARALGSAGLLAPARDALDEVLSLVPRELPAVRARVIAFRAHVDHLRGDHGAARALLESELAAQADGSAEAAELKLELASDRFFTGDWDGMYEWAKPALAAAREHDDRTLHASAAAHVAGAAYLTERIDECIDLLAEAAAIIDALPDDAIALRLEALLWLGWCEQFVERYVDSTKHLQRGIDVSRATGHEHVLVALLNAHALGCVWLGRLEDARDIADEAHEAALLAGNAQFETWSLTMRAWATLQSGDVTDAIRLCEQAPLGDTDDPVSIICGCLHGEALIENGEPARGRDTLIAAAGGEDMPLIERPFRTRWYEPLVRAEIALGDLEAAGRWAGLADEAATTCPSLGGRQAEAKRARAELLLVGGDPAGAAEHALAAASSADATGVPVDAARARTIAGRALAALGDEVHAGEELDRAHTALTALGARRYADQAARELRLLGRRSSATRKRARAASGGGGLSPREREIAELVTSGKTNREIASELFLSEKTIETHLSHVFAKLGVKSRAAVAGELVKTP